MPSETPLIAQGQNSQRLSIAIETMIATSSPSTISTVVARISTVRPTRVLDNGQRVEQTTSYSSRLDALRPVGEQTGGRNCDGNARRRKECCAGEGSW